MSITVGIAFAFIAMLCWGLGDFLIQRSSRKIGDWETLFLICLFGVVVLLPFVWKSIVGIIFSDSYTSLIVLSIASLFIFVAALYDFEALKKGKIAIVEPILSLEVPITAVLALIIIGERISFLQTVIILLLMFFLVLVVFKEKHSIKSLFIEKGAYLALTGAFLMGGADFFMGWGGRVSDPIMVMFFTNLFIVFACGIYLLASGRLKKTFVDAKKDYKLLLPMSLLDNVAWLAFVFGMSLAPIAVVTALSESYIIIAVLLGLVINHEKLQSHQKIGLGGALLTALVLASITAS